MIHGRYTKGAGVTVHRRVVGTSYVWTVIETKCCFPGFELSPFTERVQWVYRIPSQTQPEPGQREGSDLKKEDCDGKTNDLFSPLHGGNFSSRRFPPSIPTRFYLCTFLSP